MPPASPPAGPMRPLWAVADWLERSRHTVRQWYRDDLFSRTSIDPVTGAVLVDMLEAQRLAEQRPPRKTRRGSGETCNANGVTPP